MSKVTVSRIPDIDRYAGGVKNIAKTYKSTLTTANQQLVIKSEGQQADAVNKYLEKLNILQSQIFTHFPQEIGNFGTKVKNYADDLTGLGFQINVWSLDGDSGADGVASKLKGEQSTAVETVSQGFQSVLNKATDLLDENRINLTDDTTKTKQGLEDAAKQRTTMDSSIQSSYKVFKSSMQHYETLFMSFEKVPAALEQLVKKLNELLPEQTTEDAQLALSFYAHYELVNIHPFLDGNGRTSRLLMNFIQQWYGLPLGIVFAEDKVAYYEALNSVRTNENFEAYNAFMFSQYTKHLQNEIAKEKDFREKEDKTIEWKF